MRDKREREQEGKEREEKARRVPETRMIERENDRYHREAGEAEIEVRQSWSFVRGWYRRMFLQPLCGGGC